MSGNLPDQGDEADTQHYEVQPAQNTSTSGASVTSNTGITLLTSFYYRSYPTVEELASNIHRVSEEDLAELIRNVSDEIKLIKEETSMLKYNAEALKARRGEHVLQAANNDVTANLAASLTIQYSGSLNSTRGDVLKVLHEVNEEVNDDANASGTYSLDNEAPHMSHDHAEDHERTKYLSNNMASGLFREGHDNTSSSSNYKIDKSAELPLRRTSHELNELHHDSSSKIGNVSYSKLESGSMHSVHSLRSRRGLLTSHHNRSNSSSNELATLFLRAQDKLMMIKKEKERLKLQSSNNDKQLAEADELLVATVDEAVHREREIELERLQFDRDVLALHLTVPAHSTLTSDNTSKNDKGKIMSATGNNGSVNAQRGTINTTQTSQNNRSSAFINFVNATNNNNTTTSNNNKNEEDDTEMQCMYDTQQNKTTFPFISPNDFSETNNKNVSDNNSLAPLCEDQVVTRGLAEVLRAYFTRKLQSQLAQLDKEHTQCEVTTKAIKQTQMQWRQRAVTGASFHLIDLRQLAIENDNLTQSLESKTAELAKLKNISTLLVQELNGLLDAVNELQTAQSNMKREFASRKEYLAKGLSEMKLVTKESTLAQHRNEQIKLQHEQLKVPKMEEYMAQKAELFELNKALNN